ncbi:hypothetical protein DPMN_015604 [Dreissena polymorpha]|uniref:Uncharacterized protein n=1 Tax=Dreissena polymorpha TaxID=45954 RepID=A0A9D4N9H0_DREPO|nr:hypothetical protein DPMN_015604 [Dreissena polymorpha]
MKCDFYNVYNFELDRDIIGTNLLTKFHEDRTINVASRVFTNKCGRTDDRRPDDGQSLVTKAHLSNQAVKEVLGPGVLVEVVVLVRAMVVGSAAGVRLVVDA